MSPSRRSVFGWVAAAAVGAAVAAGLAVLGSPAEERTRRLDQRRLDDLRGIAGALDLHWTREGRLPESLAGLPPDLSGQISAVDPESGAAYDYQGLVEGHYLLCATFARRSAPESWGRRGDFWTHGAGRHCFEIEAKRVER